jgi:hypothetical protein
MRSHIANHSPRIAPQILSGQRHRLQRNTNNASDRYFELESVPPTRHRSNCGRVESARSSIDRIEIENMGNYR